MNIFFLLSGKLCRIGTLSFRGYNKFTGKLYGSSRLRTTVLFLWIYTGTRYYFLVIIGLIGPDLHE
jgi:uncharacterized membrane protein